MTTPQKEFEFGKWHDINENPIPEMDFNDVYVKKYDNIKRCWVFKRIIECYLRRDKYNNLYVVGYDEWEITHWMRPPPPPEGKE